MDALELLAGDPQTFIDKVWGSRVLIHQHDAAELGAILSLADVDSLLTQTGIRAPAVRVVRNGAVLPAAAFSRKATLAGESLTGLVDARKLLQQYDAGATIVLQGLQRYWPPLTELVRSLELALGHPCQANAYLTPPGSQGFGRHSDTHDVFVFQTHGEKRWEIVEDGQVRDLTLTPGTSVYLPAGTPHSARSQQVASLHVTLGINQITWRTLLTELAGEILSDPTFDEPIPAGYLDEPGNLAGPIKHRLSALADRLGDLDVESAAQRHRDRFLTSRPPTLAGGLLDRNALVDLTPTTTVRRRPTAAVVVIPDGDRVRLLLGDRELRMPAAVAPALEFVAAHDTLTPADLPGLSEQSAVVLTRRLILEGLLRVDE